jgi:hypothetical protein
MATGLEEDKYDSPEFEVDGVETVENSDAESPITTPPESEVLEVAVVTEENGCTIPMADEAIEKKIAAKISAVLEVTPSPDSATPIIPANLPAEGTLDTQSPATESGVPVPKPSGHGVTTGNQTKAEGSAMSKSTAASVDPADNASHSLSPPATVESLKSDAHLQSSSAPVETVKTDGESASESKMSLENGDTAAQPEATSTTDPGSPDEQAVPEPGAASRGDSKAESESAPVKSADTDADNDSIYYGLAALFRERSQPGILDDDTKYDGLAALFGDEHQLDDSDASRSTPEGRDSKPEAQSTEEDSKKDKDEEPKINKEPEEETDKKAEQVKEEKKYSPFDAEDSDSGNSDAEDTGAKKPNNPKPLLSRPKMPLLPALGHRFPLDSASSANLLPVECEWERRKKEYGEKSRALDQLMTMIGLEEIKKEFLAIKATIDAAHRRKGRLRRQDFNLVLTGNVGTGKRTLAGIYRTLLVECGLWKRAPYKEKRSGFDFQGDRDVDNLDSYLTNSIAGGAGVVSLPKPFTTSLISV